jgi:outer membrane protein
MNSKQNIFMGLIALAVIGLYILHFSSREPSKASSKEPKKGSEQGMPLNGKILYVQADSIMSSYGYMKDLETQFLSDNQLRENKLQDGQQRLQSMLRDYERKVPTMTSRERMREEEKITAYQQQLMQDQQELSQLAAMQEAEMISQVYDSLHAFFSEFGAEREVDFILATQKASGVLYAHPDLDVTGEAIKALDARYQGSKEDSTSN